MLFFTKTRLAGGAFVLASIVLICEYQCSI
jgi:hypothetical protein